MVRYSTALSHIFLVATGLYCYKALSNFGIPFCKISYGVIALHSFIGIWRWGNPKYGIHFSSVYRLTDIIQDLLGFPSIVTTMWIKYNYNALNLAFAHTIISVIPLILYLRDNRKHKPIDAFLAGNVLSLLALSYYNFNHFGITTSFSYALSYFVIKRDVFTNFPFHIPILDLYNYSMCFFSFFALKTIQEPLYE